MKFRRVAVLMGGWGEEREVSMRTGEAVARALVKKGHEVSRVLAGPGLDRTLRELQVDAAFLALHGRMGEDGKVQGLLEIMEVPYTGSGVLGSSLAMNKPMAKKVFRFHNIPTPQGYTASCSDLPGALELHGDLGYPVVVKPAASGSSCGLSIVRSPEDLVPALEKACRFGGEALVERYIRGREITVAILNDSVLGACEVVPANDTFDYESKYEGKSRYHLPPRLSPTRLENLSALALAAHRALGCRGYSRVDLIASDTENDFVLEVNTLPGMTQTSLLPKIAKAAGTGFEDLVESILDGATLDARPSPCEAKDEPTREVLPLAAGR